MGEVTSISWCDHTFNPWVGCSKVHTGCAHCYAEADMDKRRHFAQWGPNGTRVKTSEANWKKPVKWNKEAQAEGVRRRVFCSSLADVFEDWQGRIVDSNGLTIHRGKAWGSKDKYVSSNVAIGKSVATMEDLRRDLFDMIDNTQNLNWLLLTKRPENISHMSTDVSHAVCSDNVKNSRHIRFRDNVWLGTSVSDQSTADKAIPELLKCRDLSPVLFLSVEPLLGPINLQRYFSHSIHCIKCHPGGSACQCSRPDWVIVGGESGPNARPCYTEWVRLIVHQCRNAGVPCFVKQLGSNVNEVIFDELRGTGIGKLHLKDSKGGDMFEFPDDLCVREFPTPR